MAEYVFELQPTRDERLLPQLAAALDKCGELSSRARLPGLWKLIDRLRDVPPAPENVLRRRRVLYRVYGGLLTVSGLILLIPGLTAPRELAGALVMGALSAAWGVYCIVHRVGQGRQGGDGRRLRRFEREARGLLEGLADPRRAGIYVSFTEKEVVVARKQGGRQTLSYDAFVCAAETQELLLLRGKDGGFPLRKRELTWGYYPDFRVFLMARGVPMAPAEP